MHHGKAALNEKELDELFRQAIAAMDQGDEQRLSQILSDYPILSVERLRSPGEWLTESIGPALQSFFKDPYLLWFVSEDAPRKHQLPANIAIIAAVIIDSAKKVDASKLKEQLDYGIRLVAWSVVARDCSVQNDLLDLFIHAGAHFQSVVNDALVNGNFEAAQHLIDRGANITLAAALCLEKWDAADKMLSSANQSQKQFCLTLTCLHGKVGAIERLIAAGADINKPSADLYSHGTPLHHAVSSGSLESVKILIDAGANVHAVDTAFNGTPLGWAEYGNKQEIVDYLKSLPD